MEIEHNLKFLGDLFSVSDIWIVTGISLVSIWFLGVFSEATEKEVQDTFCWGSGGVPELKKSPKIGGLGG
jgi:hypothetical protein